MPTYTFVPDSDPYFDFLDKIKAEILSHGEYKPNEGEQEEVDILAQIDQEADEEYMRSAEQDLQ